MVWYYRVNLLVWFSMFFVVCLFVVSPYLCSLFCFFAVCFLVWFAMIFSFLVYLVGWFAMLFCMFLFGWFVMFLQFVCLVGCCVFAFSDRKQH